MATTNPTTNETHTIDNGYTSIKWALTYGITLAMAVGLLLYSHWERTNYTACYSVAGALLLAHILILLVNPSYFSYNEEGKKITVRNATDYPFFRKCNEFAFPKSALVSYKIDKSMLGFKKVLSLKVIGTDPQTKQKKEVEIDKINISSISKKDYEYLVQSLDKVLKK
ncbi:MAG: hypothetical protein IKP73_12065 [Bacteroidales bacterium]|jgi:hypothetical protein|nr:hypothetical protein [Bacteroidales bacterium]